MFAANSKHIFPQSYSSKQFFSVKFVINKRFWRLDECIFMDRPFYCDLTLKADELKI